MNLAYSENNLFFHNILDTNDWFINKLNFIKTKKLEKYKDLEFHFFNSSDFLDNRFYWWINLDEKKVYIFDFMNKTEEELTEILEHELLHYKKPNLSEEYVCLFTRFKKKNKRL